MYNQIWVEKVVNEFFSAYPRATNLYLEICKKRQKDVVFLFNYSQKAWEALKSAVKILNRSLEMNDPLPITKNHREIFKDVICRSIKIFCSREKPKVAKYLTNWFKFAILKEDERVQELYFDFPECM